MQDYSSEKDGSCVRFENKVSVRTRKGCSRRYRAIFGQTNWTNWSFLSNSADPAIVDFVSRKSTADLELLSRGPRSACSETWNRGNERTAVSRESRGPPVGQACLVATPRRNLGHFRPHSVFPRKYEIVEDVSDNGARFVYANENEVFEEGSTTPFAEAVRAQETRVTMGVSES